MRNISAILFAVWLSIIGTISGLAADYPSPTSQLQLTSATTAYSAGQLIASSATASSIVVPSFIVPPSQDGALFTTPELSTNDSTSTGWGGVTVQLDLWSAAPTFTNGDRGAFALATGSALHIGAFQCTMSAVAGDGAYSECAPTVGSFVMPKLPAGSSVSWTLQAITATGVTGASKVFTLTMRGFN